MDHQEEEVNLDDLLNSEKLTSLYPNLQSHWQEIGVPTTPFGDVDLMHFQAL